jgi:DUF2950 family protein
MVVAALMEVVVEGSLRLRKNSATTYMEKTIMHTANKRFETIQPGWLTATRRVGLALLVVSCVHPSFAQEPNQKTFASAEEASRALFLAVQRDNEQAVMQILGGGKELVSSSDEVEDKLERAQFAKKYEEMHRLVREQDGTTILYIGAENWPFPVPLASRKGQWYFDSDAGGQEILFRRVGENEATAIATCHALVLASKKHETNATGDGPTSQYANTLVSTRQAREASAPFHGYYFRMLTGQRKGSNVPNGTAGGFAFVAYPADYRSSGVMTFIVTPDDIVYQKDLGPDTARIAKAMTGWKADSSWHTAE